MPFFLAPHFVSGRLTQLSLCQRIFSGTAASAMLSSLTSRPVPQFSCAPEFLLTATITTKRLPLRNSRATMRVRLNGTDEMRPGVNRCRRLMSVA